MKLFTLIRSLLNSRNGIELPQLNRVLNNLETITYKIVQFVKSVILRLINVSGQHRKVGLTVSAARRMTPDYQQSEAWRQPLTRLSAILSTTPNTRTMILKITRLTTLLSWARALQEQSSPTVSRSAQTGQCYSWRPEEIRFLRTSFHSFPI